LRGAEENRSEEAWQGFRRKRGAQGTGLLIAEAGDSRLATAGGVLFSPRETKKCFLKT
jgi:hypothetical protein